MASDTTSSIVSSENNMITVSVKLMNGDILLIEYDPTTSIYGLKQKIQEYDKQFIAILQTLIRISDEKVNPSDICDGDSFILVIDLGEIKIRFNDESLVGDIVIRPQEGSSNYDHRFEIYSIYNYNISSSYYFIYDIDADLYAITDTCDVEDDSRCVIEYYCFTDDTIWYSSLYECLHSYYTPLFLQEHIDVQFKKYRLHTEFNFRKPFLDLDYDFDHDDDFI